MTTPGTDTASDRQIELDTLFADLDQEFATTRRVLERYPDAHADWRPHEKSMSLVELAAHVANLPHFGENIAESSEFDFATTPYTPPTARTRSEILDLFDKKSVAARKAIDSLDADAMRTNWKLRAGDTIYASGTRAYQLRRLMLSHIIHHRAQLTVYYRLLGVPVPSVYGPSADEAM
ncbi:MAG TPA: DinB family protein [Gemmatimonadaceae bacterium]|jgi:DinB family.